MKYYIDRFTDEIFAYESDGSQDAYIRPDIEPLSDDELLSIRASQNAQDAAAIAQEVNAKAAYLLSVAAVRIYPLQDAVDLREADDEDIDLLIRWKKYRIAVGQIAKKTWPSTDIDWPSEPE